MRTSYKYGPKGSPRKSPKKTPRKRKAPELVKVPKVIATDEEPSTSTVFNTDNFMSKELSALVRLKGEDGGNPSIKRVQEKATLLARRRFQASFKKFDQSENLFSQSVSPKESAVCDSSGGGYDPCAMAVMPTRGIRPTAYSARPTRANSSEDFVSTPKRKKSNKQPAKGQKKIKDFFSKPSPPSPPSPEVTPEPESPNNCEDESDLNDFTDQFTMANLGSFLSTCTG